MKSQSEKAQLLKTYHENKETFVIPNPWDIGSARLLALAGFKALATSSAGYAFTRGSIARRALALAPVMSVVTLAFGLWYALGALDVVSYTL